ncbi:unnamed protein product [Durusdinium trenchii]|uniref:MaoC-like domain-containing protein n=1 Tax=Durusdinium trenchii TaxID=1381693 RepID=A0ABP0QGE8_9DINO
MAGAPPGRRSEPVEYNTRVRGAQWRGDVIPWLVSDFRIFVGVPIYALSNIIHYVPSSSTDTKELLLNSTQTLWTAEDLIIYALGIGSRDLRYVYEKDPNFAAFPTFPVALYYKGSSYDVLPFPSPILEAFPVPAVSGVKVWLDAGITIERCRPLPAGGRFTLEGGVASLQPKGKGALMEKLYDVKDDSGAVYYRMVDVSYLVGAHDIEAFGETLTKPKDVAKAVGSRAPKLRVEEKMEAGIASIYRLSGDYNPLHVDPGYAKTAGYDHPIVHGKCTLGHAARMLMDGLAGGDQRRFKSLQLRYAAPVLAGQTLILEAWEAPDAPEEYLFQVLVKETGKVCVSNGHLKLTPASKL